MTDHSAIAGPPGHRRRFQCLGHRADLVQLDENRVGDPLSNTLREDLGIGHEVVVTHQLDAGPESLGEQLPAGGVVLRHAILQRHDGILAHPILVKPHHLLMRFARAIRLVQDILSVLEKLARRGVERQRDLLAGRVAGLLDGLQNNLDRLRVRLQAGAKPPSSPTAVL